MKLNKDIIGMLHVPVNTILAAPQEWRNQLKLPAIKGAKDRQIQCHYDLSVHSTTSIGPLSGFVIVVLFSGGVIPDETKPSDKSTCVEARCSSTVIPNVSSHSFGRMGFSGCA